MTLIFTYSISEESKKNHYLHAKGKHIHKCQDSHECDNGLLRENAHFQCLLTVMKHTGDFSPFFTLFTLFSEADATL